MKRNARRFYFHFLRWRRELIGNRAFLVLLSIIVGLLAALAAVFLKKLMHLIESEAITALPGYLFFLFPLLGISLTVWLKRNVFKTSAAFYGIPGVLDAIRRRSSFIHYSLMYAQLVTGAITIAFGGSAGLEAPSVVTGSAIGSNASRFFRLDYKYRTLFIGCGTAATIAAIFNAPIAGVIFATEVILPQFSATIFIPILIAAATGTFFSGVFLGGEALFRATGVSAITLQEIPLLLVLGFFAGLVSLYFTRLFRLSKLALQAVTHVWKRVLIGGLLLGTLIYLFPVLFGEGYIGISQIIQGQAGAVWDQSVFARVIGSGNAWQLMLLFAVLLVVKPIAASLTVNSGGDGGQFAPSFVTGGFAGYFFYLIASTLLPNAEALNPVNYVLLGMAAVLGGVMHAPLTAIFLVAEVTQSYDMFVGLMLVTAMSFFTKFYFDRVPVHFQGTPSGNDLATNKHEFISLNNLRTASLVQREVATIQVDASLKDLLTFFASSKQDIIVAIGSAGQFEGWVSFNELRPFLAGEADEELRVRDVMVLPVAEIDLREQVDLVLHKFDQYDTEYLPVFRNEKFIGLISRSRVLEAYRQTLRTGGDLLE